MIGKTLYLCYFGLREPLVQTQVLPYLREIVKGGTAANILTFETNPKETWTQEQIAEMKRKLAAEGINWDFLTYHKRPSAPATLFDVLCGAFYAWRLARRENIDVFHARVHMPAMMGALAKKFLFGKKKPKLLFDIRGFFPEEYTDAGIWKENGWLYKTVKKIEKWLFKESDAFVVLTEKARDILFPESKESGFDKFGRPVEVIPCCIDKKRFESADILDREEIRRELNIENKKVFIYVGSFGGWYLTEDMARFFAQAHSADPDLFTIILTQRDLENVKQTLQDKGLNEHDFLIKSVSPREVPNYLNASDAAISFIKACYSKQSSSPTKIAEYLAAGLPVISNSGVGDLDALIENNKVGVILQGFDSESYSKALENIDVLLQDTSLREHCRKIADEQFDLEKVAGERYRRVYEKILNERQKTLRS